MPRRPRRSAAAVFARAPKATQPAVCNNCRAPEPGVVRGHLENVSFKSQAIQLGLGAAKEIVRFDEQTLKVVDADDAKKPEHPRDVRQARGSHIA